jgi:prepilin-type processing-associated H-X9-DG protein
MERLAQFKGGLTLVDLDLIGYLHGWLDPEERARTESILRNDPDTRRRLERLTANLAPLALAREEASVPDGLADRTLAYVEHQTRPSHSRRSGVTGGEPAFTGSRWRRVDAIVSACVVVLVGGMSMSGVARWRHEHQKTVCQNNFRQLYPQLVSYSQEHAGLFPQAAERPPFDTAGAFIKILDQEGRLPPTGMPPCPSAVLVVSSPGGGGYAFPIGYLGADGRLHGLRRDGRGDIDLMPLVADRQLPASHGNGYNVLFVGGNARFCTVPTVGLNGDHIFINQAGNIAPGLHWWDSVLAEYNVPVYVSLQPAARPQPPGKR